MLTMETIKQSVSQVSATINVTAPNPGVGFRLLNVNEPIKGAFLFLGSCWDTAECKSGLIYTEDWPKHGVFYRKPINDEDKAFEHWYSGIMFETGKWNVADIARMAWDASKEFYSKSNPTTKS